MKISFNVLVRIAALLLLCCNVAKGDTVVKSTIPTAKEPVALDALFDLDRLPVLRTSQNGFISSYGRGTWNDDFKPQYLNVENTQHRFKDLKFYTWAEGERVDDMPVDAHCEAGVWRHLVVTWSLAADGTLTKCAYVDGKLAGERKVSDWRPAEHRSGYPRESGDKVHIGSQVERNYLHGALADVRVYSRPLGAEEVEALHAVKMVSETGQELRLDGEKEKANLEAVSGASPTSGPGGRGLTFPEHTSKIYRTLNKINPRSGTFAAWVNPTALDEGAMQHLFCLGADSLGLYLAPPIAGTEGVLADLNGPGCIYRVWLGGGADRTLHFYFDGEKKPRLSLRFSGPHGEPYLGAAHTLPLTSSGGELCYPPMMATGVADAPYLETGITYMPMPFKKSCKITMTPAGDKYVQVNYSLYSPRTKLSTFDPQHISPRSLAQIAAGRARWIITTPITPAPSAKLEQMACHASLAAGQTEEVFRCDGSGRITELRVKLPEVERNEPMLRGLRMRVYWDGQSTPAIDSPVGAFFNDIYGTPSEAHPVPLSPDIKGAVPIEPEQAQWKFGLPLENRNMLIGYTRSGGYYCLFPMPFASGARITLVNTTGSSVTVDLSVTRETLPIAPNLGRFHAWYNRDNPTQGIDDPSQVRVDTSGTKNHVIADVHGRGHFVGCSLFLRQAKPLNPDVTRLVGEICEGNEMIFLDDDPKLTMIGTGSEDYLNQNYWVHDHIYPYDGTRNSYDTCYRFHISDAIVFQKHLHATIEHGAANAHYMDYSSVGYWYQE